MLPGSMHNSFREATSSVRSAVGMQTEAERNDSCFPELSYQTRLYGVAFCFGVGCFVGIFSSFFLWTGNVIAFALFYSVGNVLALFSSVFMMGPKRQCRLMWKKERVGATIIYVAAMVATLLVAIFAKHPALPCLLLIVLQFAAATWYTLSYIPFARGACLSCCRDAAGVEV